VKSMVPSAVFVSWASFPQLHAAQPRHRWAQKKKRCCMNFLFYLKRFEGVVQLGGSFKKKEEEDEDEKEEFSFRIK